MRSYEPLLTQYNWSDIFSERGRDNKITGTQRKGLWKHSKEAVGHLQARGTPTLSAFWVDSGCLGPVLLCYGSPSKIRQSNKPFGFVQFVLFPFMDCTFGVIPRPYCLNLYPLYPKIFSCILSEKLCSYRFISWHLISFLSKVLGWGILFGFACQSLTVLILLTKKTTTTLWSRVNLCVWFHFYTLYGSFVLWWLLTYDRVLLWFLQLFQIVWLY